jgi:ATP-dependent DNA helicase DinG
MRGAAARPVQNALPSVEDLLAAAVAGIGGAARPGQVTMAKAAAHAMASGEHLVVQAGTGTGKSLAYLVPAVAHAAGTGSTVLVATATIALQRQLIERDLPRLAAAVEPLLGRPPTFAILKGRRNYLCLYRLREGAPEDPGQTLFDPAPVSVVGQQVRRLAEWAEQTETGDRDELVPGVDERAWRQVAVSARECLGAPRCPFGTQCYAEQAREVAAQADIIVTNHALLAIDALGEADVLPPHDVVIIDEAHDLVNRVTAAASAELPENVAETAARRCGRMAPPEATDRLRAAGESLAHAYADVPPGRLDVLAQPLATALAVLRDAAAGCATELRASQGVNPDDAQQLAAGRAALALLDDIAEVAGRVLAGFGEDIAARPDVVWMDRASGDDPHQRPGDDPRRPPTLRVAPLEVGGLLATRLFRPRTAVLTSATLTVGGSFEPLARQWGLPPSAQPDSEEGLAWSGLDAGSPFDHPRHGILYVAKHLPPPGRDGLAEAALAEMRELIAAAGGRTLGLFSSMRAARQAAAELRGSLPGEMLCQGDDATGQLIREFTQDETSCLFGTLSLWQGVDVPGPSLQLVIIDRIPFPRPDDPLASARQRAVAARGGNGFMTVAAAHAALLLAQGAGRLLRTMEDRGVVAVLDPRLVTARYGSFLRASLPPFWATTDAQVARGALRRLTAGRT